MDPHKSELRDQNEQCVHEPWGYENFGMENFDTLDWGLIINSWKWFEKSVNAFIITYWNIKYLDTDPLSSLSTIIVVKYHSRNRFEFEMNFKVQSRSRAFFSFDKSFDWPNSNAGCTKRGETKSDSRTRLMPWSHSLLCLANLSHWNRKCSLVSTSWHKTPPPHIPETEQQFTWGNPGKLRETRGNSGKPGKTQGNSGKLGES